MSTIKTIARRTVAADVKAGGALIDFAVKEGVTVEQLEDKQFRPELVTQFTEAGYNAPEQAATNWLRVYEQIAHNPSDDYVGMGWTFEEVRDERKAVLKAKAGRNGKKRPGRKQLSEAQKEYRQFLRLLVRMQSATGKDAGKVKTLAKQVIKKMHLASELEEVA